MGKIKGFLFAVRHREILMTDLGLIKVDKTSRLKNARIDIFSRANSSSHNT